MNTGSPRSVGGGFATVGILAVHKGPQALESVDTRLQPASSTRRSRRIPTVRTVGLLGGGAST